MMKKRILVFMESTLYYCRILMKLEYIFKFHENPFSGSRVVACGQTRARTDRQTDMTKLTVVLRNIANAPKSCRVV